MASGGLTQNDASGSVLDAEYVSTFLQCRDYPMDVRLGRQAHRVLHLIKGRGNAAVVLDVGPNEVEKLLLRSRQTEAPKNRLALHITNVREAKLPSNFASKAGAIVNQRNSFFGVDAHAIALARLSAHSAHSASVAKPILQ